MQSDESKVSFERSKCPQHNLFYEKYCANEACPDSSKVCAKCVESKHWNHKKYLTSEAEVIKNLSYAIQRSFDQIKEYDSRSLELSKLINYAKNKSKEQYENYQCRLVEFMKRDKEKLDQKINKMKELAQMLQDFEKLHLYWKSMHQKGLLETRIRLSSQQGIVKLKRKNLEYSEAAKKCNLKQICLGYEQLEKLQKSIEHLLRNNVSFKVAQIVAMKTAKKVQESKQRAGEEKQGKFQNALKKDKPKSKSSSNFGEELVGAITRFFS